MAGDSELRQPLLEPVPEGATPPPLHPAPAQPKASAREAGQQPQLWHLMTVAKAWHAAVLVPVSVFEAIIISRVGALAGQFYSIFVDGDSQRLWPVVGRACLLYMGAAAALSVKAFLKDYLALRWRCRLTRHLQQLYCNGTQYYLLQLPPQLKPNEKACKSHGVEGTGVSGGSGAGASSVYTNVTDNPDQRLAQDLPQLCNGIAEVAATLSAVPFSLLLYSWLTYKVRQLNATRSGSLTRLVNATLK